MHLKQILYYVSESGKCYFEEWLENLKDIRGKAIVKARIRRITLGNPGDFKSLGQGIYELRIEYGPGYRLYYGEDGNTIIIFLCGGDKDSQRRDIDKAYKFWNDYRRRK